MTSSHVSAPSGWWRRNRWWLLALPAATAILVVAASSRLVHFERPFTDRLAEAAPGETVDVTMSYDDLGEQRTRRFTVRLAGLEPVDEIASEFGEPEPVPDGSNAYAVELDFEAPRDSDLSGCEVVLVDPEGRRYGESKADPLGGFGDTCERTEDDDDIPRAKLPESWTVSTLVLTHEDADVTEVWLGWTESGHADPAPGYVALPVE